MSNKLEVEHDVNPFLQLDALVKILRSDQGCPWDRKQTPTSLKKYLLDEAKELAEAIDRGDSQHICEEIGDIYFILTLLAMIFEEQGSFSANDALTAACEKMVRRHPHVFEAEQNKQDELDEEQLQTQWERIKQEEKSAVKVTATG